MTTTYEMTAYWTGCVLKCTESFSFFKRGSKYYCFADEGHTFWIHAPFLMESYGVEQINMSAENRKYFTVDA
tara:strand:+ start:324 stop:539 length:216 start_codon:yes stop_codon:yes gene_type:complete